MKQHVIERSDPSQETYRLRAAAEHDVLAVVEAEPCFGVPRRADPSSQAACRLEQGYLDPVGDKLARAGDARYPAAYDCNTGRYGRPPKSLDLTSARAAMATLRVRGTEMELAKTS